MFITVPADKTLRLLNDSRNVTIEAYDVADLKAPTVLPDGSPWPDVTLSFVKDFLLRVLLTDQQWGATLENMYCGLEVRKAFAEAEPGDTIELSKQQYERLEAVLRRPSTPYNPVMSCCLLDFFQAIEKASSKDPRLAA